MISQRFFFFLVALGFEFKVLILARQAFLPLEPLHRPYLCYRFFEIGARELLAWAGFEP
jgi:hypothetical protein